jgi:hypothetical protein
MKIYFPVTRRYWDYNLKISKLWISIPSRKFKRFRRFTGKETRYSEIFGVQYYVMVNIEKIIIKIEFHFTGKVLFVVCSSYSFDLHIYRSLHSDLKLIVKSRIKILLRCGESGMCKRET